jgi:DNA primase
LASTAHSIVLNDEYGIDHNISLTQDFLSEDQIKFMHDNWVKKYDPPLKDHKTPIEVSNLSSRYVSSFGDIKSKWDTKLTPTGLTKRDIFRYYSQPEVKDNILFQLKDNKYPLILHARDDKEESRYYKRPVQVDQNIYDSLIDRRVVEMHSTFSKNTTKAIIDIDPGTKVSSQDTKTVTEEISRIVENLPFVSDTDIQFSGNRGYYIHLKLSNTMDIDDLRNKLKNFFSNITNIKNTPVTLNPKISQSQIRIDLTPLKENGSFKAAGSLDVRTGYISTMIPKTQLSTFNPELDANLSLYKDKLRPAYSFKNEELI